MSEPTAESDLPSLVGTVVGERYEVLDVLGDGSMGMVFLAEHTHMKKKLALKVMKPEFLEMSDAVQRFQREAQAAGHIEHPHVCSASDFGQLEDERFFLVMEYLDGETLGDLLDREKRLDPAHAVKLTSQIASGLQRAHELEIVHRDLKPENVLLVEREGDPDFVKITDFGVARVEVVNPQNLTQAGTTMGTPVYMSPEQAVARRADARSDLYTLGVMLFEMLTGEVPYYSDSIAVLLSNHLNDPTPNMHKVAPDAHIPQALVDIVERLMHKNPDERFQSASELMTALAGADLSPAQEDSAVTAVAPVPPAPVAAPVPPAPVAAADNPVSDPFSADDVFGSDSEAEVLQTVVQPTALDFPPPREEPASSGLTERFFALPTPVQVGAVALVLLCLFVPVGIISALLVGSDEEAEEAMTFSEGDLTAAGLDEERADALEDLDVAEKLKASSPADAVALLQPLLAENGGDPHLRFALAKAMTDAGTPDDAMPHYLAAVQADPRYAADARLVSDVRRRFSDKSKEAGEAATPVMAALLASEGPAAEAVFQTATEGPWAARKRARTLLKDTGEWDSLQEWERDAISLSLIGKKSCAKGKKLVKALAAAGEPGALPALKATSKRSKSGCGFLKKSDCYACLRADLKKAIKSLETPAAP